MRSETERWWLQASADFETAEVLLQGQRFYAVSWFVQQAVEKGLKAPYIEQTGTLARRTHDLVYLGREVSVPPDVQGDLTILNAVYETIWYPEQVGDVSPVDLIGEDRATQHLEAARRVFQWLDQQLQGQQTTP